MSRGVGLTELLAELPTAVVVCFALLTQLGDFWFVSSACLLAYWFGSATPRLGRGLTRSRAAMVLALLASAAAITAGLKAVFAAPRPPGAGTVADTLLFSGIAERLYVSAATGEGYGFPSGHAITTLLVWGGFAWALRVGRRRQRYAVAGLVVAVVSLARLVLGVHYLVDVVAGAAVASAVLWAAVTRLRTPTRVFALAAVVAAVGVVAEGATRDPVAALGLGVGGLVAWARVGDVPPPTRRGGAVTAVLGAVSLGVLAVAVLVLAPPAPVVGAATAAGMALAIALPLVGERVAKKA